MNLNKIILKVSIAILFLLHIQIIAQHDYVPMAVEDATYLFYTADYDFLPPWEDYYFGYKIKGDIEIDGQWYKKVYYRFYYSVYPNNGPAEPPLFLGDEYLIGAIRDDIPNKKVYAYLFEEPYYLLINFECELNTEILLYDFDMEVGDFFMDKCIVVDGEGAYINSIEEQYLFNEIRFIYNLRLGSALDWGKIYEGIGGDSGLLDPVWGHFEAPATIFLVYCVGEDENCLVDYLLSNEEYNLPDSISIYPNPVEDMINITPQQSLNLQSIQIYDLYGKLLLRKVSNLVEIDISKLSDGLYMLQVNTDLGNIYKKIIKKSPM